MVFFYVSKYVTQRIGPSLLRNGLRLRNRLAPMQNPNQGSLAPTANNNYWVDMACMIPYSQKILSLAVYDESKRLASEFRKKYLKQQAKTRPLTKAEESMATIAMMTDPAATSTLSEMRVQTLESFLRPSLIPNERWSDIEENWRYHLRIVAWARKEYLIGKYGPYIQEAMVAYPQLRNSPQLSSMNGGNRRQLLLDLVHRGEINTDNIGGPMTDAKSETSAFLRLPSTETIVNAFRMKDWSYEKSTQRVGQSLVPVANSLGGSLLEQLSSTGEDGAAKHVQVPLHSDVSSAGIEDVLEVVTKGYVKNCGPLNALCQEANFYQLYSKEYIQQLGDYLLKRTAARRLDTKPNTSEHQNKDDEILHDKPLETTDTIILDIGAGDGVLMHCLRDYMERKLLGLPLTENKKGKKRKDMRSTSKKNGSSHAVLPTMIATDDMSWRIFAKAKVEKLSVEQALQKYAASTTLNDTDESPPESNSSTKQRPQVIVLCSWMPMGQDWTSHFRSAEVDEYILIGEADDGSCGDNWLTWGNPAFYDGDIEMENNNGEDRADRFPTPSYAKEGYKRLDMEPLTKYQFSSFDLKNSKSSKTVSFRRRKRNEGDTTSN